MTIRIMRVRGRIRRQAIERQMRDLNDEQRAKILGLNAARMWKFDIDKLMKYRQAARDPRRRRFRADE